MEKYLRDAINKIGPITIDHDFIQYREEYKNKFRSNGRTEIQRTIDADCLLFEYILIRSGYCQKTDDKKEYDFSVPNVPENFCDAKKIQSKYFNVPTGKVSWYEKNISSKLLTHFVFFKFKKNNIKPFVLGDVITIDNNSIKVFDAISVIKNLIESIKTVGYYYTVY